MERSGSDGDAIATDLGEESGPDWFDFRHVGSLDYRGELVGLWL